MWAYELRKVVEDNKFFTFYLFPGKFAIGFNKKYCEIVIINGTLNEEEGGRKAWNKLDDWLSEIAQKYRKGIFTTKVEFSPDKIKVLDGLMKNGSPKDCVDYFLEFLL